MNKDLQLPSHEVKIILEELKKTLAVRGDVVEFGCYTGDTSVELASFLRNSPEKWLWLYDSFAGLPAKTSPDFSPSGRNFETGALRASATALRARFKKLGLMEPIIKKAWFKDLDPENDLPQEIAFALLDGDFYESIKTSLKLIEKKLTKGAIVVVHDYNNPALPGSRRAVDEFLKQNDGFRFRRAASLAILDKTGN